MPLKLTRHILPLLMTTAYAITGHAQTDSMHISLQQLFDLGTENSLQLSADRLKEQMAYERTQTAHMAKLPDIGIGLKGGFLGQPIVWQNGLSNPSRPQTPDWQQNYAIDFTQPLYQGGRIKYNVRKANIEHEVAILQTATNCADIKLSLLEQYLSLFSLYKQCMVLNRNIDESKRRLKDIRRMEKEGLITNNNVLRSEMQLTENRLSLTETENNIRLVSQQLDILLGLDETLLLIPDTALLGQDFVTESYTDYVNKAFFSDPYIQVLQKQTELAQNNVRIVQAEKMPQLSLTASNTLARPVSRTLADMYNNNWNIGLSVSYSLSSLYKYKHRMNEARRGVMLSRNAEEQQKQHIRTNINAALLKHHEAINRVEALRLSVKQAEENYRIMNNRYLNQLAILTDLLDADNLRLNAELELTTARTRVIYTYYELQRAIGNI